MNLYVHEMPWLNAIWNLDNILEAHTAMFRKSTDSVKLGLEWKNKDLPRKIREEWGGRASGLSLIIQYKWFRGDKLHKMTWHPYKMKFSHSCHCGSCLSKAKLASLKIVLLNRRSANYTLGVWRNPTLNKEKKNLA